MYCSFWGIAAIVWFKVAYPLLSALIEKILKETGNNSYMDVTGIYVSECFHIKYCPCKISGKKQGKECK